ncbi:unnamed protein product [Heterobilharzia americana]|nr:unnamed protein product [Heterobilharzia americana]
MKESPRHIVPSEAGKESDSISKDNQLKKSEVEAIYTKDEFTVPVSISSDVDEHAIKELNIDILMNGNKTLEFCSPCQPLYPYDIGHNNGIINHNHYGVHYQTDYPLTIMDENSRKLILESTANIILTKDIVNSMTLLTNSQLNTVRLRKEDGYKDEVQEIYGPRNSTYQKSIFKEMNQDNLSIIEEIDQLSTELVAQNTNNHFNYSSELNNTYKQSGDRHMFKASELHLQGNLCDELNKVNVIEQ